MSLTSPPIFSSKLCNSDSFISVTLFLIINIASTSNSSSSIEIYPVEYLIELANKF